MLSLYKVHYDSDGIIKGFYVDELHEHIPEPYIVISEQQHKDYLREPYYKVIDGEFNFVGIPEIKIEDLKKQKLVQLQAVLKNKEQEGFIYLDKVIASDLSTVQDIMAIAQTAQNAIHSNEGFSIDWLTKELDILVLDAERAVGLLKAYIENKNKLTRQFIELKKRLDNAEIMVEVESIEWV